MTTFDVSNIRKNCLSLKPNHHDLSKTMIHLGSIHTQAKKSLFPAGKVSQQSTEKSAPLRSNSITEVFRWYKKPVHWNHSSSKNLEPTKKLWHDNVQTETSQQREEAKNIKTCLTATASTEGIAKPRQSKRMSFVCALEEKRSLSSENNLFFVSFKPI